MPDAAPSVPPSAHLAPLLGSLRRWPDVEAPDLVAVDGTDRLLLDLVGAHLAQDPAAAVGRVVVVDDEYGALTLGVGALLAGSTTAGSATAANQVSGNELGGNELSGNELSGNELSEHRVVTWQDSAVAARATDANAERAGVAGSCDRAPSPATDPDGHALDGATLVISRLPRSLAALEDLAELVAVRAAPDVVWVAGGPVKHLTRSMNEVLARSFEGVHATRGSYKARALVASGPRPGVVRRFPVVAPVPELGTDVVAYGAAFAGPRLDHGTRALLGALDAAGWPLPEGTDPAGPAVVDLGCGTGLLSVAAARAWPTARVVATDVSGWAVASARLTADAASGPGDGPTGPGDVASRPGGVGQRIATLHDDAASTLAEASADVVLLNPPFHLGSTVHTGAASRLFEAAARLLRPGGELWTVWNSHLRYRAEVTRVVGRTEQVARDRTFTVTRTTRR